ncbi:hypothetical protein [Pseudonocardia oroxyli]|uniref:Uncharacterized protein n=1 Tax=Pseudonocardia oroxyli TaxID=366584 RepID=A0A1G7JI39_PSEOR|nr:hypothetical protein [Pseudonocardia oroxyli]SDF24563.1 hypothetical protein SAMN05216377_10460 [Pseudonocardia oroxyli]
MAAGDGAYTPGDGPMAGVLAGMPEVVERLLAQHVPDRLGRCTACRNAGSGVVWPCTLHQIATRAEVLRTRQGQRPRSGAQPW